MTRPIRLGGGPTLPILLALILGLAPGGCDQPAASVPVAPGAPFSGLAMIDQPGLSQTLFLLRSDVDISSDSPALAHNHLLVGTLAAYLQRQDLPPDLLRRYLQSPDTDRYITREAVEHLDGLTGAVPEEAAEPVWTAIGRRIARDGS